MKSTRWAPSRERGPSGRGGRKWTSKRKCKKRATSRKLCNKFTRARAVFLIVMFSNDFGENCPTGMVDDPPICDIFLWRIIDAGGEHRKGVVFIMQECSSQLKQYLQFSRFYMYGVSCWTVKTQIDVSSFSEQYIFISKHLKVILFNSPFVTCEVIVSFSWY